MGAPRAAGGGPAPAAAPERGRRLGSAGSGRPSRPCADTKPARSPVGSGGGSGAPGAEPSAGLRGLRTLGGSGSFVPRAAGARHAAGTVERGFGGPGRGRSLTVHTASFLGAASEPATRRPQPAPNPRAGPPSPGARPRPSLPGRARPAASPAARARRRRAPTCGQQCAFGLLADRIWRFCAWQRRLLRPRRFCLRWS